MDEEFMRRFGVRRVTLPVLKIKAHGHVVATVIPVGLWVIGANGRVDILTAAGQANVVNNSATPDLPDWVAFAGSTNSSKPFDKDFLLAFIRANERA
jgi:hypothetical protein